MTTVTQDQVQAASDAWKEARALVRKSIANNQFAMTQFRINKSEENKAAYEATRKAHAEAITHIKAVRTEFYTLKYQFETQSA